MQQPILDPCLINMKPKVFVKTKMNRTILALPSMQDLSGEAVMSNLIALKRQNNLTTLPPAYLKAGQDLLVC